jgi:hypothetical protein
MEDQIATIEPTKRVRDNNLLCSEVVKRSNARLREYKTLSRIGS